MLKEKLLEDAANLLGHEIVTIKSVSLIESYGNGFRNDGKAILPFEGHIFWKELLKIGIDPKSVVLGIEDILYPTLVLYKVRPMHKLDQYACLNKSILINANAAYASA